MERDRFSYLLQKYEKDIYWKSGQAPKGCIVHEWRLIENDRLILKEIQHQYGSEYFWFIKK